MRVYISSDTHYSSYLGTADFLNKEIDKANELNCDLFIHAGDVLDCPLQENVSSRRAANYHSYNERINFYKNTIIPKLNNFNGQYGWRFIAGNHEMSIHAKAIIEAFGYWYKQEVIGDVLVILINTMDTGDYYFMYVSTKQLFDIKKAIDEYNDKICIAVGHVPLIYGLSGMREVRKHGDVDYHYGYDTVRNYKTVCDILATHPRFAGYAMGHWFPASAGYDDTSTSILQIYKRHHDLATPALKDSFVVDIDTATGDVNWQVYKWDTDTLSSIISVNV